MEGNAFNPSSQEAETGRLSDFEEILVFIMSTRTERACREFRFPPRQNQQCTHSSMAFTFHHISGGI